MQCDIVAMIPAVVALNVNDSPLKSTAWEPCCCKMQAGTQTLKIWHTVTSMESAFAIKMLVKKMHVLFYFLLKCILNVFHTYHFYITATFILFAFEII